MIKKLCMLLLFLISEAQSSETIKVLCVFNITGNLHGVESPALKGVELHAAEINKAGGLLNKKMLELVVVDTESNLEKVVPLVEAELKKHNFIVVIAFCDADFIKAMQPLLKANNLSVITPGATDPELSKSAGKILTMVSFDDQDQAYAISHFARERLDTRKIVVWTEKNSNYSKSISKFFIDGFRRIDKGEVLYESFFSFDDEKDDIKELIKRLNETAIPVDAIFISANPEILKKIIKQVREAALSLPILGSDSMDSKSIATALTPKYANNIFYSSHARNPKFYHSYVEAYKTKFGEKPMSSFAALGYDAIGILATAITRANVLVKDDVNKALDEIEYYSGVTGSFVYHSFERAPIKPVAILSIQAGNVSHLLDWDPSGRLLPTELCADHEHPANMACERCDNEKELAACNTFSEKTTRKRKA